MSVCDSHRNRDGHPLGPAQPPSVWGWFQELRFTTPQFRKLKLREWNQGFIVGSANFLRLRWTIIGPTLVSLIIARLLG